MNVSIVANVRSVGSGKCQIATAKGNLEIRSYFSHLLDGRYNNDFRNTGLVLVKTLALTPLKLGSLSIKSKALDKGHHKGY